MKGEELQGRVINYDNSRVPSGIELNMNAKRVKRDSVYQNISTMKVL
jgi:hypothetical protein